MLFNESFKSLKTKNKEFNDNKIKVLHLLSLPNHPREIKSVKDITTLCNSNDNFDYYQIINKPFKEKPPFDNVILKNETILREGHYGCFLAHKNAILEFIQQNDYRWLLIVECDCKVKCDTNHLMNKILESIFFLSISDYKIFTFGGSDEEHSELIGDDIHKINRIIGTQMYLIDKNKSIFYKRIFSQYGWHTIDLWYNYVFKLENQKFLYRDNILTCQYLKHIFSLIEE